MNKILGAVIAGLLLSTGAMAHERHHGIACPPGLVKRHDACVAPGHVRRDLRDRELAQHDARVRHQLALRDARIRHEIALREAHARHQALLREARIRHQAQLEAARRRHAEQLALRR
ncbi:hypothetical protein [Ramlibacter sp.]|uniref:hypothetical protein n=1 Tax=Ramlibacter sp. TaxID=1917967 RepID=UPI002D7E9DF5|nr:hypothetical protein [Ramlibacter sp.]